MAPDKTPRVSVSQSALSKHVVLAASDFQFVFQAAGQHRATVHQQFPSKTWPADSPTEMLALSVEC